MRRYIPFILCFLLAAVNPTAAQKKRNNTPALPTITLAEAIQQYRFDDAEQLLLSEIENLRKKDLNTDEAEEKLHAIEKAQNRLNATEQVMFIDSIVVSRDELFQHIRLSEEVGNVSSYADFFNNSSNPESSVYISQMKDKMYYSEKNAEGHIQLFTKDKEGNTWSEPTPLAGLDEQDDLHQNYPFMLSDGLTLYYAAKGPESIGGYDIFMTRYDADNHSFLTPENIGMPFNSPANDYLYIEDDFLNLGWFVTDRNQPEGKVCIYTFIPNVTRKVYTASSVGINKLRSYARLNSIRDTWHDKQKVNEAVERLQQIKQSSANATSTKGTLQLVINDNKIVSSAEELSSESAKSLYKYWYEGKTQLNALEQQLDNLRSQLALKNDASAQDTKTQILSLEQQLRKLRSTLHQQEKEIRAQEAK